MPPPRRHKKPKKLPLPTAGDSPKKDPVALREIRAAWLLKPSALLLSFMVGAIGAASAVVSFYPKITITPKHLRIPGTPGTTQWEIRNDGSLPLTSLSRHCSYVSPSFHMEDGTLIGAMVPVGANRTTPTVLWPGEAFTFECDTSVAQRYIVVDVTANFSVAFIPSRLERTYRFQTGVSCAKDDDGNPNWIQKPAPEFGTPEWKNVN